MKRQQEPERENEKVLLFLVFFCEKNLKKCLQSTYISATL